MAYVWLNRGYKLPAVGVFQKLLKARGSVEIGVDGSFGRNTQEAVKAYQRSRSLGVDGIVGAQTWDRISRGTGRLQVIDCIDVFDPSLARLEQRDITRAGGTPLVMGGMSNGVEQAVSDILRAVPLGEVFLLRFHGHGASGLAGVSVGHGNLGSHRSIIDRSTAQAMSRLRPIFGPYGCVQFMHCKTGQGPAGRAMLAQVAQVLGVPASAGIQSQYGGGTNTFRYHGPTHTALPGNQTLRSWCSSRPDFAGMSR